MMTPTREDAKEERRATPTTTHTDTNLEDGGRREGENKGIVSYILTNRFEGDLAPCYAMLCLVLTYAIGA
jgi:hypothetical protein